MRPLPLAPWMARPSQAHPMFRSTSTASTRSEQHHHHEPLITAGLSSSTTMRR